MNKILVTVYVPVIEKKYDIFVPINVVVSEFITSLQDSIVEMSNGFYEKNDQALLIDSLTCKVINAKNIVKFSGLRNGSLVMLL